MEGLQLDTFDGPYCILLVKSMMLQNCASSSAKITAQVFNFINRANGAVWTTEFNNLSSNFFL